jgi:phosphatidylinositol alpha-1,6-mannosyltransferase
MPLGTALGLSGGGGLSGNVMVEPSLRVLALVTDAFGGRGGIAQYNRDFLSSLATCDRIGDVIVLPRAIATPLGTLPSGVRQLPPVQGRLAFSLAALWAGRVHRPIDVVFCGHLFMAPLAAVIARLLHARLWVQVHGTEAWQELSRLYRHSVEAADLVTAVSRYTRRHMLEWIGIDPARVKILPNTVDPRFHPGPKRGYLLDRHDARGKKILMTVSRLAGSERYKGHDRVIRSLPQVLLHHPEAIYLIVGDGDDRPRLEALASEFAVQDKVRFAGLVASEDLPDYYRLADVLVMPSTGEGFGIVFLEAMACAIDVIGGNQDGSIDPLGDGAVGSAIDPEDSEELVSAISAALRKPAGNVVGATRFKPQVFSKHIQALVCSNFIARS